MFKVIARRYGDSVAFSVEGDDVKNALANAHAEANRIFGYKDGDSARPVVSVKPGPEGEDLEPVV